MAASLMMPTAGAGAGHAGIAQVAAMSSKVLSGKYEVGMKLGEGLQGKVYMGKSRETGQLVALKCMDSAAIEANPRVMANVKRELQAMVKVSEHGNVVKVEDVDWKAEWPKSDGSKKVADFGLAAVTEDESGAPSLLRTRCGTKGYMAPEVLARNSGYQGGPADVWSAAVILFIMVAGFPPLAVAQRGDWWFDRIVNRQWVHFWKAHERSMTFSPEFKDLLQRMFAYDSSKRATVAEVLSHPWVTGSTPAQLTLLAEMDRRRKAVDAKKQEERKVAAASQSSTGDVDLLGGGVTRGGGGAVLTAAPLPTLPFGNWAQMRTSTFYAGGSAKEVLDAVAAALASTGAKNVQTREEPGAVAVSAVSNGLGIIADVYADGAVHLVDMHSAGVDASGRVIMDDDDFGEAQGTGADFRAVFESVRAAVTDMDAETVGTVAGMGSVPQEPVEVDEFDEML
ncbi:CIPK11 [Symbiodinium sp. KB8]|nr:CIPK11 [Symbiodinium sp. KB8]